MRALTIVQRTIVYNRLAKLLFLRKLYRFNRLDNEKEEFDVMEVEFL